MKTSRRPLPASPSSSSRRRPSRIGPAASLADAAGSGPGEGTAPPQRSRSIRSSPLRDPAAASWLSNTISARNSFASAPCRRRDADELGSSPCPACDRLCRVDQLGSRSARDGGLRSHQDAPCTHAAMQQRADLGHPVPTLPVLQRAWPTGSAGLANRAKLGFELRLWPGDDWLAAINPAITPCGPASRPERIAKEALAWKEQA